MSTRWPKAVMWSALGAFIVLVIWFVVNQRSTQHLSEGVGSNALAHYSHVHDKRFKTVVGPKDMDDSARWDGVSSPRLALEDALRIARARCAQVEAGCGSWGIREAGLELFVPDRYYYLITLTPTREDIDPGNGLRVVVFMNGQSAPLTAN